MMLLWILAAVAAAPTPDVDELMSSRFGNTSFTQDRSGRWTSLYYEADHTFTGKLIDGSLVSGTWIVEGGELCITWSAPPRGYSNPTCSPVTKRQVGDTWTAGPFTTTLLPGRQ